jgi:hypothetical protein
VADAIGELRGKEVRNTYAAITLTELMSQHADRLDKGDSVRPSRLARLTAVRDAIKKNLSSIKAIPPAQFRTPDPDNDANTAP